MNIENLGTTKDGRIEVNFGEDVTKNDTIRMKDFLGKIISKAKVLEVIDKFSFDLITDVHFNNAGMKRFTKRKAIILCHLKKELGLE